MSFLPPKDKMNEGAGKRPDGRYKRRDELEQQGEDEAQNLDSHTLRVGGFGPPQYGEESQSQQRPTYDEEQLRRAYQNFSDEETEGDEDLIGDEDDEGDYDEGDEYLDDVAPQSLRQPGGAFLQDEPLFPGGPMVSEVNSWKKQFEVDGHAIMMSDDIGGETFIWRTLSRTEYREIMNLPNTDPLQREEIICEICVLFPYNYKFDTMASRKAGIPAVLAEQILHESGFKKPSPPIRL